MSSQKTEKFQKFKKQKKENNLSITTLDEIAMLKKSHSDEIAMLKKSHEDNLVVFKAQAKLAMNFALTLQNDIHKNEVCSIMAKIQAMKNSIMAKAKILAMKNQPGAAKADGVDGATGASEASGVDGATGAT